MPSQKLRTPQFRLPDNLPRGDREDITVGFKRSATQLRTWILSQPSHEAFLKRLGTVLARTQEAAITNESDPALLWGIIMKQYAVLAGVFNEAGAHQILQREAVLSRLEALVVQIVWDLNDGILVPDSDADETARLRGLRLWRMANSMCKLLGYPSCSKDPEVFRAHKENAKDS